MLKIFICIAVFLLFFSSFALSETIQLKSGRTIEGEIVERRDDYIRVDFRGITLTYYLDEIEAIDGRPPAEERETLSTSPASPHTSQLDRAELKRRLKVQLKELHYPEHTHPALKEELIAFFERIDLSALQSKAQYAKGNPDKLRELAQKIRAIFEREGFLDNQSPRPLIRLLVDSFGDDDILKIIEESPLSQEEKGLIKTIVFGCAPISQLGSIVLNLLEIDVKVAVTPSHVFNYILFDNGQVLFTDFSMFLFEMVDIEKYYQIEGSYRILRPEYNLSSDRRLEMIERWIKDPTTLQRQELYKQLNFAYLQLHLTDGYSVTACIYANFGTTYLGNNNFDQAIIYYDQALRINPNFAEAYANRGYAYAQKGDLTQAIFDYNLAIQLNPHAFRAYNYRGVAYHKEGNYPKAVSDFTFTLKFNPGLDTMGYAQALLGNHFNATVYFNRGTAYFAIGNYRQAITDFDDALKITPDYVDAYVNRASAHIAINDFEQAIIDYNHALQINSSFGPAYANRAIAYSMKGDYTRAWEDVRRAQELGYQVPPDFLSDLRRASGRER